MERKFVMSTSRKDLGDGLVIKTADDQADVERVMALDCVVFDDKVGALCQQLFLNHPDIPISNLIFVEDESKGEIVSTLCLIPWKWKYDETTLNIGEMGIVGTAEAYRNRGLIRSQVDYFKTLLNDGEFDISIIQGIPYFYRQFGYEYSIPLEMNCYMELHQIPDLKENENPKFTCRLATSDDLPLMQKLYDETSNDFGIYTLKNEGIWRYLSENSPKTCTACDMWVVEDANKQMVGYFFTAKHPFGNSLSVAEVSKLSYDASLDVLRQLKKLAVEGNKPNIRLNLPKNCEFVKVAKYHGAYERDNYAWQIYIPDMVRFFSKIAPTLEKRLSSSPFAGLTEDVRIGFYTEKIVIHFDNGQVKGVERLDSSVGGWESIRIPPKSAVPLFLGYRDREESSAFWKDMGASPKYSYLLDVLFPKMDSHIYSIY
jgi:hypothetical protein